MGLGDFDNTIDLEPEQGVVTVTTAGTPVTFTPASGRNIQVLFLHAPKIGPNAGTNGTNDYILYSTTSGSTYHTLKVNESISIPGSFSDVRIDSSKNGMKVEIEVRT